MKKMRISLIELILIATMCGKFYFLFGFSSGSHLPQAPTVFMLFRELTLFSLLTTLSCSLTRQSIFDLSKISFLRFYSLLFVAGIIVSTIHFINTKDTITVLQHYIRNNVFVSIIFPTSFLFFAHNKSFSFRKVVLTFAIINVAISIFQLLFFRNLMWATRPTGIIGDPLINSAFILISFFFLIQNQDDFAKKIINYTFITSSICVLYAASSISALFAWGSAIAASSFIKHQISIQFKNAHTNWLRKMKMLTICFLLFVAVYQIPIIRSNLKIDTQVEQKIHSLISFLYCKENCDQPHGSISGRMLSYQLGIDHCKKGLSQCLVGDFLSSKYSRLDATWSSLLINWGLIYTVLYYIVFLVAPLKKICSIKFWTLELQFASFVYFFYWAFSLFNCVFYKYPLNVLFYMCTAQLLAYEFDFKNFKKRESTRLELGAM